ncbi:hypothetical protein HF668_08900 [Acidithiobacillus ferridurans]|uniref:hypothetical protein n=1 Tax=Acidithiobacillus ferridurans TaxID=1232575 RepID=UPI001C078727|nr:hypothetical protein [Acidithiobacillus ferridurans]MBU2805260.1 hypothetical protein [Acidithiobacillus ferridurans]
MGWALPANLFTSARKGGPEPECIPAGWGEGRHTATEQLWQMVEEKSWCISCQNGAACGVDLKDSPFAGNLQASPAGFSDSRLFGDAQKPRMNDIMERGKARKLYDNQQ